ncbi:MAG: alginate export family protein [Fimbriimonadaceae bacterium]
MLFLFPLVSANWYAAEFQDQIKATTDVEARARLEGRSDPDFARATDDANTQLLLRIRPGVTVTKEAWTGRLQFQYTEGRTWKTGPDSYTNDLDASLVYLQYSKDGTQVTIGRQKVVLADQRLIGPLEWANRARSFDGARYKRGEWDVAAFAIGVSANRPRNARVGYVSRDWNGGKTTYILKTDSLPAGNTTVHTLDHVWKGAVGEMQGEVEAAIQAGGAAGKDHFAFALHAGLTRKIGGQASVTLEANMASGGSSAGNSKTFDNLFPTNHLFYGSADLVSWRNMQEIALRSKIAVDEQSDMSLAVRKFWLFDSKDAWYGAGGGPNRGPAGPFLDPTGGSGRDLGTEIDFEYGLKLGARGGINLGAALFVPGHFVKNQVAGPIRNQLWFYASSSFKF